MASLLLAWLHHNRRSLYTSPGGSVPSISISLHVYINMLLYDGVCCVCVRGGADTSRRDGRCAAPTIDDEGRSQQNIITSRYRYWFVGCSAGVLLYVAATVFLPTLLDDDGFLFAQHIQPAIQQQLYSLDERRTGAIIIASAEQCLYYQLIKSVSTELAVRRFPFSLSLHYCWLSFYMCMHYLMSHAIKNIRRRRRKKGMHSRDMPEMLLLVRLLFATV